MIRQLQVEIQGPTLCVEVDDLGSNVSLKCPGAGVPNAPHESAALRRAIIMAKRRYIPLEYGDQGFLENDVIGFVRHWQAR